MINKRIFVFITLAIFSLLFLAGPTMAADTPVKKYVDAGSNQETDSTVQRLAGISFGPVDAVEEQVEELDKKANKYWSAKWEDNNCTGDASDPQCDGTVQFPQKVLDYWENHPKDRPDSWSTSVVTAASGSSSSTSDTVAGTRGSKWSFKTGGVVAAGPAINSAGTIFFGSYDKKVYALQPDKTKLWDFKTGGAIRAAPALSTGDTVYVASEDKKLYALDSASGSELWHYKTGGRLRSSPAVGPQGTIYVGSTDGKLYAINPNGSLAWTYSTGGRITSSPATGSDTTVYVGSWDSYLYAIRPDNNSDGKGELYWQKSTGAEIKSSPAIGRNGTIYCGSHDNHLYAYSPSGNLQWNQDLGGAVWSSPVIGGDSTVYVGSWNSKVYALNPDGSIKWDFTTEKRVTASPLAGQQRIYVGSHDNSLYALNPGTPNGSGSWKFTAGDALPAAATLHDTRLYVGSGDNYLYALEVDTPGAANSNWPQFGGNQGNSGQPPGSDTIAPAAPVADTATGAYAEIKLTWQEVTQDENGDTLTDFSAYRIYRTTADTITDWKTNADLIASLNSVTDTTYVDTDVTIGDTFYYRITAVDNAIPENESNLSDTLAAVPQPWTGPTWYVNDTSTVNDVYTSALGSDSNTGGPNDPFRTISYGMNFVSAGDTVRIDAGTYGETVAIDTDALALVGADSTSTVLDYGDTSSATAARGIYSDTQSNLRISNLRVINSYNGIELSAVDVSVVDQVSVRQNGNQGINLISGSDTNTIKNSTASLNGANGVQIQNGSDNTVINNKLDSNGSAGIQIWTSLGTNKISGNVSINNSGSGIALSGANNDTVSNNTVKSNGWVGISLQSSSQDVFVWNNTVFSSSNYGIELDGGQGHTVKDNAVDSSLYSGIFMNASGTNTIQENIVERSKNDGIRVQTSSPNNVIQNNLVKNSSQSGVVLEDSQGNVVKQNDVTGNDTGVRINFGVSGSTVTHNNFTSNTVNNFHNNDPGVIQTLTRNWWGSTDRSVIDSKFNDDTSPFSPYRLGVVDTGVGADTVTPAEVVADSATADSGQVKIYWQKVNLDENGNTLNDFSEYRLYRTTSETETDWKQNATQVVSLSNQSDSKYVDDSVTNGDTYYYRLTAVDDPNVDGGDGLSDYENESYFSDTISAQPQIPPATINTSTLSVSNGSDTLHYTDLAGDTGLSDTASHQVQVNAQNADSVVLYFRRDGTTASTADTKISLSNTTGDTWQGTLPETDLVPGDTINFILEGINSVGDTTIEDSGGVGFKYRVNDAQPTIDTSRLTVSAAGDTLTNLQLDGTNNLLDSDTHLVRVSAPHSDTVYLRYLTTTVGAEDYTVMTNSTADTFQGSIPLAQLSAGDTVDFYLEGINNAGDTTIEDSGGVNFKYRVKIAPYYGPDWYVNDTSVTNDIYTSDTGTNDPLLANGSSTAPYRTVSEAMNYVSAGDTIFADAGTYGETVTIDTDSLDLVGADSSATILDFGDSSSTTGAGIYADTQTGLQISNLRVINSYRGIEFNNVDNSQIDRVTVRSSGQWGIYLQSNSDGNSLTDNRSTNNTGTGFLVNYSDNNALTNNTSSNNGAYGYILEHSLSNTLNNNIASNNASRGFSLSNSTDSNTLTNNISSDNGENGFLISNASGNILKNNIVSNNATNGFKFSFASNSNVLVQNTVDSNAQWGILIEDSASSDTITKNNITPSPTNPDSGLLNVTGNNHKITRNWWGTTDEAVLNNSISDPVNSFTPYRLGKVDTGVGADTIAPAIPTGDTVVASLGQLEVSWSQIPNAAGDFAAYRVYRTTQDTVTDWKNNAPVVATKTTTTETSYVDNSVLSTDTYYYRITAVDAAAPENESFFSDTLAASPTGQGITITSPADGHDTNVSPITVSGNTSADNVGDSVSLRVDGTLVDTTSILADSSWTATGVGLADAGGTRTVQAELHDTATTSNILDSATINVVYDTVPPTVPSLLSPAADSETSVLDVTFDWTDSADSYGVKNYTIEVDTGSSVDTSGTLVFSGTKLTSDTMLTMPGNDTYTWHVLARDDASNTSGYSQQNTFVVDVTPGFDTASLEISDTTTTLTYNQLDGTANLSSGDTHDVAVRASSADTVQLYYRKDGSLASPADTAVELSNTSGDTWTGTIPRPAVDLGDTVNFILEGINNSSGDTVLEDRGGLGYEYWVKAPPHNGPIWYVNDTGTVNDVFTANTGSDFYHTGSSTYPLRSISYAMTKVTLGDTVRIDAGTYGETVTIDTDALALIGADSTASGAVLDYGDSTSGTGAVGIFVNTGLDSHYIANLRIQNYYQGIEWEDVNKTRIENVTTRNMGQHGFYLRPGLGSSDTNALVNNVSEDNLSAGFSLEGYHNGTVRNNIARNNAGRGFVLDSSTGDSLTENIALNNGSHGFYLWTGADNTTLERNISKYNGESGFFADNSNQHRIVNNLSRGNGNHGLEFNASSNCVIEANEIVDNDTYQVYLSATTFSDTFHRNNFAASTVNPDSVVFVDEFNSDTFTFTKNYWNTTDRSVIEQSMAAEPGETVVYSPYRLGVVDTGVGADTVAPSEPTILTQSTGDETSAITWSQATAADFLEYRVYRDTTGSLTDWKSNATVVATKSTPTDTEFVDTDVLNGDTYHYRVTAVDNATPENESFFSDTVSLRPANNGPVWYVNDTSPTNDTFTTNVGSDTNTGSFYEPFRTISHAMTKVAAGDTVRVDAGTYGETVAIDTDALAMVGADSTATVLDFGDSTTGTNADAINIDNSFGVLVKNLQVTNAYDGVAVFGGASGVTIENITSQYNGNYGIQLSSDNNTVTGNLVSQNGLDGISIQNGLGNMVKNNTVRNNDNGIRLWGVSGSTDNVIENNLVETNTTEGVVLLQASNNRVISNIIQNNTSDGVLIDQSNANYFAQNTIQNNGQYEISFIKTSKGDTLVKNNITTSGVMPDSAVHNTTGETHTLTRNYWNSTDSTAIRNSIVDTSTSLNIKYIPYRLRKVDTGVGADTNPPAIPANIVADTVAGGTITISWDEVTTNQDGSLIGDFEKYTVYRLRADTVTDIKNNYDNIFYTTTDDATDTSLADGPSDLVSGDTYYYVITALDDPTVDGGDGTSDTSLINESYFSTMVSIVAP